MIKENIMEIPANAFEVISLFISILIIDLILTNHYPILNHLFCLLKT